MVTLTQDAGDKITVCLDEQVILFKAKEFFKWRKDMLWTPAEEKILYDFYSNIPVKNIIPMLCTERTTHAINMKAFRMGLSAFKNDGLMSLREITHILVVNRNLLHYAIARGEIKMELKNGCSAFVSIETFEYLLDKYNPVYKDWLSTADAAKLVGYSPCLMTRYAKYGVIDAARWGKLWKINPKAVQDLIAKLKRSGTVRQDLKPFPGVEVLRERSRQYQRKSRRKVAA